jgi:hypothetical protein
MPMALPIRRRRRIAAARTRSAWWLVALAAVACATGPWDIEALEARQPALAAISQHRLGDATPYLLPVPGGAVFFLCRWPGEAAIPVSLPPDATPEERAVLEAALRAWEGAGLGIRFAEGAAPGAGIELRFIDPEAGATSTSYAANTITDCAVEPAALSDEIGARVPARLVFASVYLWRGGFDAIGRPVPHSQDEFAGSALHEIGHALGFQGHAHIGRTVMVKELDAARRAGKRLLAGRPFEDHTLRALYAVPSGTVVKRFAAPLRATERVGSMARIASERGFAGPWVRVGDIDGQIAWRDAAGAEYALRIFDVRKVLREPATLELWPTVPTLDLLGGT